MDPDLTAPDLFPLIELPAWDLDLITAQFLCGTMKRRVKYVSLPSPSERKEEQVKHHWHHWLKRRSSNEDKVKMKKNEVLSKDMKSSLVDGSNETHNERGEHHTQEKCQTHP